MQGDSYLGMRRQSNVQSPYLFLTYTFGTLKPGNGVKGSLEQETIGRKDP